MQRCVYAGNPFAIAMTSCHQGGLMVVCKHKPEHRQRLSKSRAKVRHQCVSLVPLSRSVLYTHPISFAQLLSSSPSTLHLHIHNERTTTSYRSIHSTTSRRQSSFQRSTNQGRRSGRSSPSWQTTVRPSYLPVTNVPDRKNNSQRSSNSSLMPIHSRRVVDPTLELLGSG